ncbi:DNA damage response protein [Purpureocillium lavendulum]|uniref:histone acetyltransferase n=1 Tax=Purpureocillium lavendulum TaxID=1247861 RepID=A0AB34FP36_9HYPO|nr:DNA damage response protein [Purpureocillium lavendulum]
MAAVSTDDSTASASATSGLRSRLAAVLPKGQRFRFHHVSTPPHTTDALYSAPPNERPDRTYCENHFLTVSVAVPAAAAADGGGGGGGDERAARPREREVIVLGIEVFVYTTAHATTLFVSKADSTGFLDLLALPKGTPSPIRHVCAAFVGYLVEVRRRQDVQFVVSLFARAQSQYLFPGSVDYSGKHVLDDRGLVKWWCRVLDPLMASPPPPVAAGVAPWKSVRGYIVVPGLDEYETRAFIPRAPGAAASPHWTVGHPLERISHYTREFDWVPPRCLIPRFPDDPKSRFRDELDEEAARSGAMQTAGSWKSVKTLDMFWEMMAFRQECSSGRMTGFIWVVFDNTDTTAPVGASQAAAPQATPETPKTSRALANVAPNTTPKKLFPAKAEAAAAGTSSRTTNGADSNAKDKRGTKKSHKKKKKKARKLRGTVKPRQPRVKTAQRNYLLDRPTSSKYYYWPVQGRGEHIVSEADYKRVAELLLHLDFSTLDKAAGSSRRWFSEAGTSGGRWGFEVTGELETPVASARNGDASTTTSTGGAPAVNNLSGLVKRKRADTAAEGETRPAVNVLGAGLVKKKPKHDAQP